MLTFINIRQKIVKNNEEIRHFANFGDEQLLASIFGAGVETRMEPDAYENAEARMVCDAVEEEAHEREEREHDAEIEPRRHQHAKYDLDMCKIRLRILQQPPFPIFERSVFCGISYPFNVFCLAEKRNENEK